MNPEMSDRVHKARVLFLVVVPLLLTVFAIILLWNRYVFAMDIALLIGMYALSVFGIGIGYHRLLTHQGFKTYWPIRFFFIALGAMAWNGGPVVWASSHIKHHAHSDQEDDPHSPIHGFWHSHLGWLFAEDNFAEAKEYAPHLLEDKVVMFIDRTILFWLALALIIPFALGGWTGLLWGGAVRIFLTSHVTWSVNSICHTFGKRPFETVDESRNEWIIGLLAFGEGWHNNHHAFPRSVKHGLFWYQFDLSALIISLMEKLGLAWEVQRVGAEAMETKKRKTITAQEKFEELRQQLLTNIAKHKEELSQFATKAQKEARETLKGDYSVPLCKKLHKIQDQSLRRLERLQKRIAHRKLIRKGRHEMYARTMEDMVMRAKTNMRKVWVGAS